MGSAEGKLPAFVANAFKRSKSNRPEYDECALVLASTSAMRTLHSALRG
jgi:hypothetical protein